MSYGKIKMSGALVVLVMAALWAIPALAFDHLEITVVNPHLVGGHPAVTVETPFSVNVRAVNADGTTDVNAGFIHAQLSSPDVAAVLPGSAYLLNGEHQFDGLRFLADGQPVRLRVRDADDASVPVAEVAINCYNFVHHFDISVPAGPKFVDQPIDLTIIARDAEGTAVLNFRDDVTLDALVGHFPSGPALTLNGGGFSAGQITAPVTFWGTDPVTRENELRVRNSVTYPGQSVAAEGVATITPLRPGPLDEIVLLLPGETLTPASAPARAGSPMPRPAVRTSAGSAFMPRTSTGTPSNPPRCPA